jgi:hypothetical protein
MYLKIALARKSLACYLLITEAPFTLPKQLMIYFVYKKIFFLLACLAATAHLHEKKKQKG